VDAECTVRNHTTTCQCPQGFVGDPFTSCGPLKDDQVSGGSTIEKPKIDYCNPTPCGANTTCRVENIKAVCSCLEGFIGNPIEVTNKKKFISFSFKLIHIFISKICRDAERNASLTFNVVRTVLVLGSVAKILAEPAVPMPNVKFA